MTPCEKKGYEVGDLFVVIEQYSTFDFGAVVQLYMDDASSAPLFKGKHTECTCVDGGGAYMGLLCVAKVPKYGNFKLDDKLDDLSVKNVIKMYYKEAHNVPVRF